MASCCSSAAPQVSASRARPAPLTASSRLPSSPVGQYDDRCVREHVLHLAVRQVAETPVDPLTHAELACKLLQRLDGIERIAGDDQTHVRAIARHEWKRAEH